MDIHNHEKNNAQLLMAKVDLAILKDLFHTLNDASISLPSLNSSIALMEKYIDNASQEISEYNMASPSPETSSTLWKNSTRSFAYQSRN